MHELWAYRELAWFLAWRDLKVRYKQAFFGVLWAIGQPVAGVVVFTIVFRRFADVPSDGVPYTLFAFVGLTCWTYHSVAVTRSAHSLVANAALVTKVYFPRLLAPVAATLAGLLDLGVSLLILLGVLLPIYGEAPGWTLVTLPLWIIALVIVAFGTGLALGTLNVRYRDVSQAVALLVQLWLFISPVAYPSSLVSDDWRVAYFLNPVAGPIEGVRWSLLGTPWPGGEVFISLAVAAVLVAVSIAYFERAERRFADVI